MEMMRKANTSIKGKLLLVRSLSQDEDDVQEIIKKTDNDSPVAPKLTLGQHPVLGKLPLVRIINSFLPYDEFIQVELRRLIDEAKNNEYSSLYLENKKYLIRWASLLQRSKRMCKIGRKRLVRCSAGIVLQRLHYLNQSDALLQSRVKAHECGTTLLFGAIYWNIKIVVRAFLFSLPRARKLNDAIFSESRRKYLIYCKEGTVQRNVSIKSTFTALQLATALGYADVVKILFQMKELNVNHELSTKHINQQDFNGAALHISIQYNNMKCFKLLLSRDDVDINLPVMFKQYTPLMMCAIYGRVKMLDILLSKKNIDINFVTQASVYYNTAIKCACVYRRFHILTLLISRCEHTLDIYCGGNVHILSCLYKTFNDGLLFSRAELETNPYYIYIQQQKYIYYTLVAQDYKDEWKQNFQQVLDLLLKFCSHFDSYNKLSPEYVACNYLNVSNTETSPLIMLFATNPFRNLHSLNLLINQYPLCIRNNPLEFNTGNNVVFKMLQNVLLAKENRKLAYGKNEILYEATITEDVQILRNLIYMPGYHRENWTKHNKTSHNVFTIIRKSLKTTYNEIDEVGYEFVKMLSKMFGEKNF